jgi:hypothetical protein
LIGGSLPPQHHRIVAGHQAPYGDQPAHRRAIRRIGAQRAQISILRYSQELGRIRLSRERRRSIGTGTKSLRDTADADTGEGPCTDRGKRKQEKNHHHLDRSLHP